jgi:hypothetical protein
MDLKPGQELDVLIAEKIMAWKRIPIHSHGLTWMYDKREAHLYTEVQQPPKFSTDISAAWTVLENICGVRKLGGKILKLTFDGTYCCTFGDAYAHAATAAHAICLAALKERGIK